MNQKQFENYMRAVINGIDSSYNHHKTDEDAVFNQHGRWALHKLEKVLRDKDQNIRRWLNGKPCVYFHPRTHQTIFIQIGNDLEALFGFLTFYEKLKNGETLDEDYMDYLALIITRSNYKDWEEC